MMSKQAIMVFILENKKELLDIIKSRAQHILKQSKWLLMTLIGLQGLKSSHPLFSVNLKGFSQGKSERNLFLVTIL